MKTLFLNVQNVCLFITLKELCQNVRLSSEKLAGQLLLLLNQQKPVRNGINMLVVTVIVNLVILSPCHTLMNSVGYGSTVSLCFVRQRLFSFSVKLVFLLFLSESFFLLNQIILFSCTKMYLLHDWCLSVKLIWSGKRYLREQQSSRTFVDFIFQIIVGFTAYFNRS